jgi:hypothetical protein
LTNLKVASDEIDPTAPSPVLIKLVECLQALIGHNAPDAGKPTLILAGDLLELALADDSNALMTFERFVDQVMNDGVELFADIIYIPGNHDHHLWESSRESQYVDYITSPAMPWGASLPSPWHTTHMFSDPTRSYSLTSLINRRPNLAAQVVATYYPNFALRSRNRYVVFHHGHFIEPIYHLMSTLKTMLFPDSWIPAEVWNLEAENFAWIDFFWSTLGRSSAVGEDMSRIYEKLQNEEEFKKLLANMAQSLAKKSGMPGWVDSIEAKVLQSAFDAIYDHIGSLERNQTEGVLGEDCEQGLYGYVDGLPNQKDKLGNPAGPLVNQMRDEGVRLGDADQFTFVFGHTHKPFQEKRNFQRIPGWANVYNSGGWVVDSVERQPFHGGAVILVDENLAVTSLRMYNESADPSGYAVTVQEASHPGDSPGAFHQTISNFVSSNAPPWKDFSDAVARAISVRAQNLKSRIYSSP